MVFFLLYSVMSLRVLIFEPHLMAESSGRGLVHCSRAYCSIYSLWMEGGPSPAAAATCGLQPACVCLCVWVCVHVLRSHFSCGPEHARLLHHVMLICSACAPTEECIPAPPADVLFFPPLFFKIYSLFVLPCTNQMRPECWRAATGSIRLM